MFAIDGIDRAEFETLLRAYGKECAHAALRDAGVVLAKTLSAREVADLFGFASVDPVYQRAKSGELPSVDLGGTLRFLPTDVDAYLRGKRSEKGQGT